MLVPMGIAYTVTLGPGVTNFAAGFLLGFPIRIISSRMPPAEPGS